MTFARTIAVLCTALLLSAGAHAQAVAQACKSTVTGDLRLHTLTSKTFGNSRQIRVLLPPGYESPENRTRRYPVLYMLDGQNLFDACLSDVSHVEWGVDETVYRLIAGKKLPPLIVVGVDHAGRDRAKEYLPYTNYTDDPDLAAPEGKRFPGFLVHEVMPLVNGRYRTLTGLQNTGLGGSSYGGVATLYALMARPQTFGYGLIESPSLAAGMGQLVRDTNPFVAMPFRIFIGFGGKEADWPPLEAKMIGLVRQVESNLRLAGYDDSSLRVVIDPEALHTEGAWARRLPDALVFLFGDWQERPWPPR